MKSFSQGLQFVAISAVCWLLSSCSALQTPALTDYRSLSDQCASAIHTATTQLMAAKQYAPGAPPIYWARGEFFLVKAENEWAGGRFGDCILNANNAFNSTNDAVTSIYWWRQINSR